MAYSLISAAKVIKNWLNGSMAQRLNGISKPFCHCAAVPLRRCTLLSLRRCAFLLHLQEF
jgi:hypothetical protein